MNHEVDAHEMIQAPSPAGPHTGYMPGFGNDFETEALPGALPQGMNSPQKCNYGLYGEQLSGTAFTAPSHQNERTWCYRIRPSVKHSHRYTKIDLPYWKSAPNVDPDVISLGQYRWDPVPHGTEGLTWLTGMRTMTTAGDVNTQVGMASHIYLVTDSMMDSYFYSADSELLVVPQEGRLRFATELGIIDIEPQKLRSSHAGWSTGSKCWTAPVVALSAKITGRSLNCPAVARSVPTAWQIPGISRPRWRHLRIVRRLLPSQSSGVASFTRPKSVTHRWMSWPGTATTRR